MHKYSNVDVISLHDQQLKSSKGPANGLIIKKEDEQKQYSLIVQDGKSFDLVFGKDIFWNSLGSSTVHTIALDQSVESMRSGSTGITISLPKQKHLSYLLKFSNQDGKRTIEHRIFEERISF